MADNSQKNFDKELQVKLLNPAKRFELWQWMNSLSGNSSWHRILPLAGQLKVQDQPCYLLVGCCHQDFMGCQRDGPFPTAIFHTFSSSISCFSVFDDARVNLPSFRDLHRSMTTHPYIGTYQALTTRQAVKGWHRRWISVTRPQARLLIQPVHRETGYMGPSWPNVHISGEIF